jgi:hypothetical protein
MVADSTFQHYSTPEHLSPQGGDVGTFPQMQNGRFRAVKRWSVSPPLQQALSASQSQTGSPSMARNKRRHFQLKPYTPVIRIQRSVSRFNVLRTSTLGSRASSATQPGSIYSSHPAERSAASASMKTNKFFVPIFPNIATG